jgi:hypothetical protein
VSRTTTRTLATSVKVGDIITFDDPRYDVAIESIGEARCDYSVILRGNNDTYTLFLKPTDTIRVLN